MWPHVYCPLCVHSIRKSTTYIRILFGRARHCSSFMLAATPKWLFKWKLNGDLPNQFTLCKYIYRASFKVWACDDNESIFILCTIFDMTFSVSFPTALFDRDSLNALICEWISECVCFGSHLFSILIMLDKIQKNYQFTNRTHNKHIHRHLYLYTNTFSKFFFIDVSMIRLALALIGQQTMENGRNFSGSYWIMVISTTKFSKNSSTNFS